MREFEVARMRAIKMLETEYWVKWIHDGTKPAYTAEEKSNNVIYSELIMGKHCSKCMNINGCCFPINNMPDFPLHQNCHCRLEPVYGLRQQADFPLIKLTDYIFHPEKSKNKGKNT